jgi:hypothetical protein
VLIHSAIYTYIASQSEAANRNETIITGADLYDWLDGYFADLAREVLTGAPAGDGLALAQWLVPTFHRFSVGAQAVHRLLNYMNRHYVHRAADEDRGWLRLGDSQNPTLLVYAKIGDARQEVAEALRVRRSEEYAKWGVRDTNDAEVLAAIAATVEAASAPDCVVPIVSLCHRRFRLQVIEPLLAVPKGARGKGKGKKKPPSASASKGNQPKGRLAQSVKTLLESPGDCDTVEQKRLAQGVATCLRKVGLRPNHPLHQRFENFLTHSTP